MALLSSPLESSRFLTHMSVPRAVSCRSCLSLFIKEPTAQLALPKACCNPPVGGEAGMSDSSSTLAPQPHRTQPRT